MKRIVLLMIVVISFCAFASEANAQDRRIGTYANEEDCLRDVKSGNFVHYVPSRRTPRRADPNLGEIELPLEDNACVLQRTVGSGQGKFWASQSKIHNGKRTFYVFDQESGKVKRNPVCGNSTAKISYPEKDEEFCKNLPDMTMDEAEDKGYTVTRDGRCIKPKEPEPPKEEFCKNLPDMTLDEAEEAGYTVTVRGRCIKPKEPEPPKEEFCKNLPDMTLDEAEEAGYTVTPRGRCIKPVAPPEKPKKSYARLKAGGVGAVCGVVTGVARGSGKSAGIGGLIGAGAGLLTKRKVVGCAAGVGGGFIGGRGKKGKKTQDVSDLPAGTQRSPTNRGGL